MKTCLKPVKTTKIKKERVVVNEFKFDITGKGAALTFPLESEFDRAEFRRAVNATEAFLALYKVREAVSRRRNSIEECYMGDDMLCDKDFCSHIIDIINSLVDLENDLL